MRNIFIFILLFISICCYGAIYSNKTGEISKNYDSMDCESIKLNNSNIDNTYLKVMHTNNEVFIGVRSEDLVNLIDRNIYNEENPNYDKIRIEISLCQKDNQGDILDYIIYPGGIIYDARNKNTIYNNKYKVYPKINKDYWDFVLIVDKKIFNLYTKNYDDWCIKVNKLSNKDCEYLGNNQYEWVDLYWTSDIECFKSYESKKNSKLQEVGKNLQYLPQELQKEEKIYIDEIKKLSEIQTRDSVNKIRDLFTKIDILNTYCLGADQQKEILKLKEALPFMFSFVDCSKNYNINKIITYRNKTSLDLNLQVGQEVLFGIMLSPYLDINNLNVSYEGSNLDEIGVALNKDNIIDVYDLISDTKLHITKLKSGESKLLLFKVKGKEQGNYKSFIVFNTKDPIKLPVNINVGNKNLPCEDRVIASLKSDYNEINDNTFKNITKICSFLVKNNIYSVSLDLANCDYWFDFKENEFGKYYTNSKNFDFLVKTLLSTGIKNIYIESLKSLDDEYRVRAFAKELASNNRFENIYLLISENNKEAKIYNDYINILKNKVNIVYEKDLLIKDYSIYDNSISIRQDICKIFLNEEKEKLLVDCSNLKNSLIYYENDKIIPSLRLNELKEGIIDISYFSILKNKIKENKKTNKSTNDGEQIINQFKDLQLMKSPELLSDSEFDGARNKIIEYCNK